MFNSSIMIVLPLPWPTKAPFNTGLNGASSKLFFYVYFCLTNAILNDMVKAVYVHAPDKSKGYREQQIDISYDLVGILPASLLNDLQNGETA